ncbi:MAG: histidine kinase [Caldimonas sp.]
MNVGLSLEGVRDRLSRHAPAIVVVVLLTLYLSTQILFQPHLLEFWTPLDVALSWLTYLGELSVLAVAMATAYAVVEWRCGVQGVSGWRRLAWMAVALYAAAVLYTLGSAALRNRLPVAPDVPFALASAARWGVIAFYVVAIEALRRRVRETDAQALATQVDADALLREREQLRLQLLKAQIEPHFLFNTLANVRRLYRTEPERGGHMMASLKRYLRAALPSVRRDETTLADELALVRSYLDLISVRLGPRFVFDVRDESAFGARAFPSMVVLTLVENAIKHGIEPSPNVGSVRVRVADDEGGIAISVADDGVGLGGAQSGGTGVGLANIRGQLQSCYGSHARLSIRAGHPGVVATIAIDRAALR